jgi:hypothetical protein
MVNKKAIFRIVEASIAILIVLGVILVVSTETERKSEIDFSEILSSILDEVSRDVTLRDMIFSDELSARQNIKDFIENKIKKGKLDYEVKICYFKDVCSLDSYPVNAEGDIFFEERVISSSLDNPNFKPKKIKLFLWRVK